MAEIHEQSGDGYQEGQVSDQMTAHWQILRIIPNTAIFMMKISSMSGISFLFELDRGIKALPSNTLINPKHNSGIRHYEIKERR